MNTLDEALRAGVDELTGPGKGRQPLLSTTGTQAAIAELIARTDRLERAVATRRAPVTESAVANSVTSTPRRTRPSVRSDTNCSHGP
jgi:hypothetical protein